jgi:uncharacterized protein with von Willebrand factor type A (vWA) domain
MSIRYGAWHGGNDPLEPPFDVRDAVDEIGESVLSGDSPRTALERLLRRGMPGSRGLDALRQRARKRAQLLRRNNRLDGTLERVRQLLDQAVAAERRALFPDPDDAARLAETELAALPSDTARAVRELAEYSWRSAEAAATYQQIQELLRSEVLDAQFAGLREAMTNATPQDLARVREMVTALNDMLDSDARGEHTPEQFGEFMARYGDFFPDHPADLAELVDSLARRAAATQRLMNSLTSEQRGELSALIADTLDSAGLAEQMGRLQRALRSARPDLPWDGRESMDGDAPMGYADATQALAELADLDSIEALARQDYPGASLADIDPELVEQALGRAAVDDLAQLRRIEEELHRQGYLQRSSVPGQGLTLSPRALRRLGSTALRRVFAHLASRGPGAHDIRDAGPAGEATGYSRAWEFGDEQPLDVARTVRNAVLRTAAAGTQVSAGSIRLHPEDFEVAETERRSSAAVALLVDMSFSMELRGTWGEAKTTALALHSLISTRFPQDSIQIIGFSDYARVLTPTALIQHEWVRVQGTNLQHALMLARRHLDRHRTAEPVIMVITDGEPTAHLTRDGIADFDWPPTPETIAATLAEVARCTRRGATINVFMLDDEPSLVQFMSEVARRNGGRLLLPTPGRLGEYVITDYLRSRTGRSHAG